MKLINPEVRIETTSFCNANCIICPRDKLTRPKTTMGLDHFCNLVKQAHDLGAKTISLFGYGEPLLDKTLVTKIKICSIAGFETYLSTNASLLSNQKANDLLKAGLSQITFSMHGFGANYEKVHKGLKWIEVLGNVYNFIALNDKKYGHSCKIRVCFIPMNGENVADIRNFWEKYVDYLEIWKPHNWTNGKSFRKVSEKRRKTCGRPFRGPVQINADGKMMVCCFDFDAKLTLGCTYKNTIEEILKGENLAKIQQAHKDGNLKGLICNTCDQLNITDEPLLYSNREEGIGKTSSTKFNLLEGL